MKIFLIFLMLLGYTLGSSVLVPLTTLIRTPEHDTAVVESARVNGNFAYSTVEGHAYKAITPTLGNIVSPGYLIAA